MARGCGNLPAGILPLILVSSELCKPQIYAIIPSIKTLPFVSRKKVENILLKREEKVFSGLVLALLSTSLSVLSSYSLHSNHRALKCAEFP